MGEKGASVKNDYAKLQAAGSFLAKSPNLPRRTVLSIQEIQIGLLTTLSSSSPLDCEPLPWGQPT